jgi:hypothetical protein
MPLEHAHQLAHFDVIIACDDLQQTDQELAARGALPGVGADADAVWLVVGVRGSRRRLRAGPGRRGWGEGDGGTGGFHLGGGQDARVAGG